MSEAAILGKRSIGGIDLFILAQQRTRRTKCEQGKYAC